MALTSKTGHSKNVANFEALISFCTGYGAETGLVDTAAEVKKYVKSLYVATSPQFK